LKNQKITDPVVGALANVRRRLDDALVDRADARFNLLDRRSGNRTAPSVVELSLHAPLTRQYRRLDAGVDQLQLRASRAETVPAATAARRRDRVGWIADDLPRPAERPCWRLGLDPTPAVRPFAETGVDRGVGSYPNPAPGHNPSGGGQRDSVWARWPERGPPEAPGVMPLRCERVPTAKKARAVAVEQVEGS
jgi:hypothetical protein